MDDAHHPGRRRGRPTTDPGRDAASRRDLLASALLGALPLAFGQLAAGPALAGPPDPERSAIRMPGQLEWTPAAGQPPRSADRCVLAGDPQGAGLYYSLVRWWPGFMSAPHTYTSDAFCVVVSGTWWCNSGPAFDPAACVPVPAGGFVRRAAGTTHYDGVIRGATEPAVVAICGVAPVNRTLVDPSRPGWRRV